MGKVLIEKLLRSCPHLSNIYLLIRSKKGKDVATRIQEVFDDPVSQKSKLSYGRRSDDQHVLVPGHHLGPATNFSCTFMGNMFRYLRVSSYGASSLTRGWVYNLAV
jgi:hypothetical protein